METLRSIKARAFERILAHEAGNFYISIDLGACHLFLPFILADAA
jgi:hypothetical protein